LVRRRFMGVALALVVVGAALSGCAGKIRVDPQKVDSAAKKIDDLSEIIGGSPHQRMAGEILQYHADQDPIKACMGRSWLELLADAIRESVCRARSHSNGARRGDLVRSSRRHVDGRRRSVERSAPNDVLAPNPGYESLDADGKTAYAKDLQGCVPRPIMKSTSHRCRRQLGSEYTDLLGTVFKNPEIKTLAKDYRSCIRKAGYDVDDYDQLLEELVTNGLEGGSGRPPEPARRVQPGRRSSMTSARPRRPM